MRDFLNGRFTRLPLLNPKVLRLVAVLALAVTLSCQQKQELRQQTTGHTYYASPGDNLASKIRVLRPGDTLVLNDGTYTSLRLDPNNGTAIHGTATAPIAIKAANDGKAIFDPHGSTQPIFVNGSSFVTIQGFVARNSVDNVVYLFGGGGYPDDHITLRRITAYNAAPGNNIIFENAYGNSHILIEDCAGWGVGRYIFDNYHVSYTTLRRTFAYWESEPNFAAPRAGYAVYGSHDIVLENVISRHVLPPSSVTDDPQEYAALYRTTNDTLNYPTYNTTLRGVMFYDNWDGMYGNGSSGLHTQITNSYFESPNAFSTTAGTSTNDKGNGINWWNAYDGTITNSVFANSTIGFARHNSSAIITINNSVFLNNGTAITNATSQSYNDFYGNGSNGVSLASTDTTVNPGYETTTYGRGAYLMLPPALQGKGQNGADIGANILYEYQDGVLTNQPLWPWPMENRIMAEKGISVTWASNGGIWETLNGVYP